jgi:mRNA interferase MazF
MDVEQGEVYRLDLDEPIGSESGFRHPYVIIQNDRLNRQRINTVIMCALTSNMSWATFPGNVTLRQGEAGLPKASVVNVTQIYTADKSDLVERIGKLSARRVRQILDGLDVVLEPLEAID